MELYPPFPTCREDTPKRQAEKQIYEAFQACDFDGRVLYEVRPLPTAPQLDFAVWIVGVGIFGIQVKGGKYLIIDGQWFLITDRGWSLRESPVPGTWDAAMAIRDVVQEMFHQSIFVIPVLAMPNMEPNEDIKALAGSRNVAMHWGDPSQIVDHLVQLAIDRKVYITPTPASIAAQVQLVEPGLVLPRQAPAGTGSPAGAPHPRRALAHPHPPGPVGTEPCPLRSRCPVKLDRRAGAYVLKADLVKVNIERRRRAEATEEWRKRYDIRAGIEGTNSELKRAHGLGRLRVRGGRRVRLAVYLKALACNFKRMMVHARLVEMENTAQRAVGTVPAVAAA